MSDLKMAISVSGGPVALDHDRRKTRTPNVDPRLSKYNINLKTCENLEEEFNDFFQSSVDDYNNRQKRADRKVENYYREIVGSTRKEKPCFEYVIQIGNRDNNPLLQTKDGKVTWGSNVKETTKILAEYAKDFEKNNPHFHVISSTIHLDEPNGTPHLHIVCIPWADGYKQKLETRCSYTKALSQMGYKYDTETKTQAKVLWKREQERVIEEKMKSRGIEREYKEGRTERIANGIYQNEMKKIDDKLSDKRDVLSAAAGRAEKVKGLVNKLDEYIPPEDIAEIESIIEDIKNETDGSEELQLEFTPSVVKERVKVR